MSISLIAKDGGETVLKSGLKLEAGEVGFLMSGVIITVANTIILILTGIYIFIIITINITITIISLLLSSDDHLNPHHH